MERYCPACGTQRADGAGFCGQCGQRFELGVPEAAPQPEPAAAALEQAPPPLSQQAPPAAPPKRPLTFGQKILLGLFLIGFLAVSFVITEAQIHARHPHYHGF